MPRYSVALTALLSTITAHLTSAADPWSYLSVDIPVSLSDMAVSILTYNPSASADGGNATTTTTTEETKQKIILTGGCTAEDGNVFLGEYFACLEITDKVRRHYCVTLKLNYVEL